MIAYTRSHRQRVAPPTDRARALVHQEQGGAERLARLGLPPVLARMFADVVDTRRVEVLVEGGCELELALRIAR